MIAFARELLCEVVQEVQPLLEMHYQELCANKSFVKLDPRWDVYRAMEAVGCFVVLTAREDGKLVGYNAFFLAPNMHYAGFLVAQCDVFFIDEPYRRGTAALRFLRYSESVLKELGAQKLCYHCKLTNNLAPILRRLGYADEEVMCAKVLHAASAA